MKVLLVALLCGLVSCTHAGRIGNMAVGERMGLIVTADDEGTGEVTLSVREADSEEEVVVRLARNDGLNDGAPVYTEVNGTIQQVDTSVNQGAAAYHGIGTRGERAAVMVSRDRRSVDGVLTLADDGFEYLIESGGEQRTKRSLDSRHTILKRHVHRFEKSEDDIERVARANRRVTSKHYGVELLVVIDYSTYKRFNDKLRSYSKTLKELKRYFTQVVNGVDLRFADIDANDFSIYLKIVGFFIATSSQQSPMTENYKRSPAKYGGKMMSKVPDALNAFTSWVKTKRFPTYDHAMLFTSYDLYEAQQGSISTSVAGMAGLRAVCTDRSTSINEDHGGFSSIGVASHELGHSFGAKHDGEHPNQGCPSRHLYIMAPSNGESSAATAGNPFRFSPCSVSNIRNYINSLGSRNCLKNTAKHADPYAWKQHTQTPPGQLYTIHEQCQQLYGESSYFGLAKHKTGDSMCRSFFCSTGGNRLATGFTAPARGTSCGNNKWCIKGKCVYDRNAPSVRNPEICFGAQDLPGRLQSLGGKTCREYVDNQPSTCYNGNILGQCCQSCAKYKTTIANCEFGDKHKGCSRNSCSIASNRPTCCKSCSAGGSSGNTGGSSGNTGGSSGSGNRGGSSGSGNRGGSSSSGNRGGSSGSGSSQGGSSGCQDTPNVSINGRSCQANVNQGRHACYGSFVAKYCCGSCSRVKDNSNPSCPYGDNNGMKINGYMTCRNILQYYPGACRWGSIKKGCCKLCA